MAARHGQEIDEGIKVPQPVMNRRGGEHQHVTEAPRFHRLAEFDCDLRRWIDAVEVSQLVRLIENEHLESILGNLFEMYARGMIGRDDRSDLLGLGLHQLAAGRDFGRDVELALQLVLPLRPQQFRADDENF